MNNTMGFSTTSDMSKLLTKTSTLYNRRLEILQEKDVPLFPLGLLRTYLRLNGGIFGSEDVQEENDFLLFSLNNARKLIEEQTQRSILPKYIRMEHRNIRFELPFGPVVHVDKVFYHGRALEKNKDYTLRRLGETYVLEIKKYSFQRDQRVEVFYYTGYGNHGIPSQGPSNGELQGAQWEERRSKLLENFMAKDHQPYFSQIPSMLQNAVLRALDSLYYQRGQGWEDLTSLFQEKSFQEQQDVCYGGDSSSPYGPGEKKFSYLIG